MKSVLIWGRYGNYGPDYPRNRVIESVLRELGHEVSRFLPRFSFLADWESVSYTHLTLPTICSV